MLVPKLRFKEFTNEWNYFEIGKLFTNKSKSYNPNINNERLKCIELENINQESGTINSYILSISQKSNKNIFNINEVLFGKLRPYLKKYWYTNFKGVCSSEIWVLKTLNDEVLINHFIFYLIQSHYFLQLCNLSTGSKMPRADWNYICNQFIGIPKINEQERIANFLSLLDKKIELQSKKIEALKLYSESTKKVLFNDSKNWNYKKICEVLDYERPDKYIVKSTEYNDSYFTPVLTANKGFILGYTNETKGIYDKETIIFDDFTMDYKYVNFPFKIKSSAIKLLTSKEINLRFIVESLNNLNLVSTEHKRHYITFVQDLEIPIPSKIIQDKIATILKCFDKKINNENKYLLELEILKKGLMQNMFV